MSATGPAGFCVKRMIRFTMAKGPVVSEWSHYSKQKRLISEAWWKSTSEENLTKISMTVEKWIS